MSNELSTVFLFFGAVIVMLVGIFVISREQRRLLREIRKVAALYPPYPPAEEEEIKPTSVHFEEDWKEDKPGRD